LDKAMPRRDVQKKTPMKEVCIKTFGQDRQFAVLLPSAGASSLVGAGHFLSKKANEQMSQPKNVDWGTNTGGAREGSGVVEKP